MSEAAAAPLTAEAFEEGRAARTRGLRHRGQLAAAGVAGAFLAAASAFAILAPSERDPSIFVVALLVVGYALASRVEFEVGPGAAIPTQLVLVPMLFVLPIGHVPLAVATGLVLRNVVDHSSGALTLRRMPIVFVNACHAFGPALVLLPFQDVEPGWKLAAIYGGALAAQFAVEFMVTGFVAWTAHGSPPRDYFRVLGWVFLVDLALTPIALTVAFTAFASPLAAVAPLPLVALLAYFARERRVRIDHAVELSSAYRGTAMLLGDVVEADDAYTGSHSRDVVDLVLGVCDELRVPAEERRTAEFAALLHDVGKIRIPSEIINKPGPLDELERQIIETHTVEGEQMLDRVGGLLGDVGRIIRSCHERWDGGGYPDRLAGTNIPLVARIVCCCDAFSAMTTDRPYRRAMSESAALAELERCAGSQFDPAVVRALVRVIERG